MISQSVKKTDENLDKETEKFFKEVEKKLGIPMMKKTKKKVSNLRLKNKR